MADSTLTLDAEINTGDWNAGVKDIQSGSRQIVESARQADDSLGDECKHKTIQLEFEQKTREEFLHAIYLL